jgi:uncharacterized membrane protein YdbT with pleckstrin-like domain
MSYAQSVLQPGETIIRIGRLHWIGYWPAAFFLIVGVALTWWERARDMPAIVIDVTALTFGALFLAAFAHAWFNRWITEFAVTNRRVIYKRGFINRRTAEMNMDKVESVDVDQTIPGRLLGYGTIHVKGTGQSIEPLRRIAAPIEFRNAITAK